MLTATSISKSFLLTFSLAIGLMFIWLFLELAGVDLAKYFAWLAIPIGIIAFIQSRSNYLSPVFAFVLPWLFVIEFSALEISNIFRQTSKSAVITIIVALCVGIIVGSARPKAEKITHSSPNIRSAKRIIFLGLIAYLLFTVLQIGLAGYVPLIRGILTGDTGYKDFGIHSIYGLYNAYATALATASMYIYFMTKRRIFLLAPICVFFGFILLVTRQNILTLLVQWLVVYSIVIGSISKKKILAFVLVLLLVFAAAGEFRTGDIRQLIQLKQEFIWLPSAFIWFFSYMYFNVLNLDNTLTDPNVPYFDGRSIATLIPSSFRPEIEKAGHLEVSNFTVSSFLDPIVADGGIVYVVLFVALVMWLTNYFYLRARKTNNLLNVCIFSTLYFCMLFSFFSNFWLYLPVISQIFFFVIFNRLILLHTSYNK